MPACSIVLIPGFMSDEMLWHEFESFLPGDWAVFHAPLTGDQTISEIARRMVDLLPERFVLIGFSLGGYIARQIAADYPERVNALVIVASSLREDTEQQINSKRQALQALSKATFKGLSRSSIVKTVHPSRATDAELIGRIQLMGNRLGHNAFTTQSTICRAGVPAETIRCPTLVVASANDALRSLGEANELVKSIPNSSLLVFDGSGHMIPLEQPQELADAVVHWLNT